jgi:glutathione S-transferase
MSVMTNPETNPWQEATQDDAPIILHHYWRSPFSEKVRLAFGIKRLSWVSVEQPRFAPKPLLTALTGGYRRTPVMQIGADIYCDTRCILDELERRHPTPSLYPDGTAGLAEMVEAFADRFLFADVLGLVFGLHGERFPEVLHADRARFTADRFDGWNTAKMREKLPSLRFHFAARLGWLETLLADGRPHLLGREPSVADLAAYHPIWYASENLDSSEFNRVAYPRLSEWADRMAAYGHGTYAELEPAEAVAVARGCFPLGCGEAGRARGGDEGMPTRDEDRPVLAGGAGRRALVIPDDWGFDPVEGELLHAGAERITLLRADAEGRCLHVHFPHTGFLIRELDS